MMNNSEVSAFAVYSKSKRKRRDNNKNKLEEKKATNVNDILKKEKLSGYKDLYKQSFDRKSNLNCLRGNNIITDKFGKNKKSNLLRKNSDKMNRQKNSNSSHKKTKNNLPSNSFGDFNTKIKFTTLVNKKNNQKLKLKNSRSSTTKAFFKSTITMDNITLAETGKKKLISNNCSKQDINDDPENFTSSESDDENDLNQSTSSSTNENGLLHDNSLNVATDLFSWMINPVPVDKFKRIYWESAPLLIRRKFCGGYYSSLLSTPEIDLILRNNNVLFGKHLDVTSYSNGQRETHNQIGRAQPHVVWDYYSNLCSIRLLNPQVFVKKIQTLTSTLQEFFGCFVGSNVYLTPPGSQGFAPHYDDIEAFVLQIEGKKHWKIYKPRSNSYILPRYSSPNFSQEEIGEPMLDVVLQAGDMLYFPRGYIHQASTVEGEHSLHITLSAYQHTAWVDLLEKLLPMALKRATMNSKHFRKGLPLGYLNSFGYGINPSSKPVLRKEMIEKAKRMVSSLASYLDDLDAAVDQMGVQFIHDALPPVLTPDESKCSVFGDGLHMMANGILTEPKMLSATVKVKFLRSNICRLVEEEGEIRLYYNVENPLEYHAEEPQYLLLSEDTVPLIKFLIEKYPNFVTVNEIPYPTDNDVKYQAVCDLWDRGILITDRPLEEMDEEI
uniref:Bifunctional lysine-specific demethylase and histidyl-hydroxylase n=1 Tax=Clastoptera arizonana TaxID=38151 RepID=A0A1B6DAA9_9HEMI